MRYDEAVTRAEIDRWTTRLLPVLVVVAAAAPFLPALANGFVGWDDPLHFLQNPFYRGLGPAQLKWMFEGPHLGQYFPVAWLTLGLDYTLWGMEAGGYHLTSILFHAASACLLYFILRRLLESGAPRATGEQRMLAAAVGALAYAVHPLRVESVVWASERRDVVSLFFYLSTTLCYLRAVAARGNAVRRWRAAALACFAASLLSKAIGVTLPFALMILDEYPLRRRALAEKIPFFVLSAAALLAGWAGLRAEGHLHGLGEYGWQPRVAQGVHSVLFYLVKTAWPSGLRPLYQAPAVYSLTSPRFASALIGSVLFVVGLWSARRRIPALTAAGMFYLITLAPVSGIVRNGMEFLAVDRYCYLASLAVGAVLSVAVLTGLRRSRGVTLAVSALVLAVWSGLSWRQTGFWHDSLSLWGRTLAEEPDSVVGHMNMAAALAENGDFAGALSHSERAVALQPDAHRAHEDLGAALLRLGRPAEAEKEFAAAAALDPSEPGPFYGRGLALDELGRHAEAADNLRRALALDEADAKAWFSLGNALLEQGRDEDARAAYERALSVDPALARARLNLAVVLTRRGRYDEALAQDRLALRSREDAPLALRGLLEARFDRGAAAGRAGRYRDAAADFRAVLARDPAYPGARDALALTRRLGRF
jgi:Flp pilus assembly protein TadD